MIIKLNEIHSDGESFDFSSKSGELNTEIFKEFGKIPYTVDLQVTPIGDAYEIRGSLSAEAPEVCSRCGSPFEIDVHVNIDELVYVMSPEPRNSSYSKVNNFTELDSEAPNIISLYEPELNVGKFIYELIAVEVPPRPLCGSSKAGPYTTCAKLGDRLYSYDESLEGGRDFENVNPFAALKDFLNR